MARGKAAWDASLQSRYTDVDGVRLHDRSAGTGPPVVFVHGLAVSSRYFIPTIKALAPWYECRAVDLPGFGDSDDPGVALDITGLADALAAWLRANRLEEAVLIGNSAGCQVVVDCVARHRKVTGPVVLVGPTMDPTARSALGQIGRWLRTGWHADVTQLPLLLEDTRRAGLRRVARTFRAALRDDIEAKLPLVTQPVLVIRGSHDPVVSHGWARTAADAVQKGRLEIVAGGAHVVHYTLPHAVGLIVREFLAEIAWP